MLKDSMVCPTIPVSDLERAKQFYETKLGLEPDSESPDGQMYTCGGGSKLLVYESAGAGTSQGTYAAWTVDDLDSVMEDLQEKSVRFEEYDMPNLKTVDGVATYGDMRSAWFKDPDGNILALTERKG